MVVYSQKGREPILIWCLRKYKLELNNITFEHHKNLYHNVPIQIVKGDYIPILDANLIVVTQWLNIEGIIISQKQKLDS
jgi:hypothetical protein